MRTHPLLLALSLLALTAAGIFFSLPNLLDRRLNSVEAPAPYPVSEAALKVHDKLFIADLHDDVLLWERDLLNRHSYGHSDLPRMLEARAALQVFSTVTKTPRGMNIQSNGADSDNITPLAMAQRWPRATWDSLLQRALYQAEKQRRPVSPDQNTGRFGRLCSGLAARSTAGCGAALDRGPAPTRRPVA